MSNNKPFVVGIAGGTGSGKSTVIRILAERMKENELSILHHDSYYRSFDHLKLEERQEINFDHPDSLDTDLMISHLRELLQGKNVDSPVYDFAGFKRTGQTITIPPAPVILVDGILIYTSSELSSLMDLKLFVDADDDIRFIRRLERDIISRGRTQESVRDQYLETVKPMHDKFVEPSKRKADLIIPKGGKNEKVLDLLLTKLKSVVHN